MRVPTLGNRCESRVPRAGTNGAPAVAMLLPSRALLSAFVVAASLCCAACAGEPPPKTASAAPTAAKEAAPPEENTWGPQSPQPKWFEEKPPCPEGANLVGQLPPKGNVVECVNAAGLPHGLSSVWFPNGHEGTMTEYKNGTRHGRWMHWLHNHVLVEGSFKEGRRDGDWRYWFDDVAGFDLDARYNRAYNQKNYVVEHYNNGLLVKTTHFKDGKAVD